jgi:hypothetical protein
MGHYTLSEISLEDSSVKVTKHATESSEADIRVLKARGGSPPSSPQITTPEKDPLEGAENTFDSMF